MTSSLKAYTIDVIRLGDIDDIVLGTGATAEHLVLKHSQTEDVTFVSKSKSKNDLEVVQQLIIERNELAQIIRTARSRVRSSPSVQRTVRPSDVPGTLLNVALLNLSARDETLRLASLSLVHEIVQFFKYDVKLPITNVEGEQNVF